MRVHERKLGILLNYACEGVKILSALIYTPLMLRLLGQSEYGLYQLVVSTVSYLSLLSFGFGSAYVRYYSGYRVRGDCDGIARLNGMFLVVFCTMSGVCLLCGGVMTANAQFLFGSALTEAELSGAKPVMAVLVAAMALAFPNSLFSCYVTAHERFVFQKLLNLIQSILNPFLTLPLLLLGHGAMGAAVVSAGLTLAVFGANVWFCRKKLKMRFAFRGLRPSLLKEMWGFTIFIFLDQVFNQLNWNVDKFLLGRMCGTAAVAVYGIGSQINSLYIQMSVAVSGVFTPRINEIAARSGSNEALTELMAKVGRIQLLIVALIFSGFVFFGRAFIVLWAGDAYQEAYWVALLLMGAMFVPMIQTVGIEILRAKNRHRVRALVFLGLMLGNILLSILLIPHWGSVGAALGTVVTLFVGDALFMNWYYQKRIGLDMRFFWREMSAFLPPLLLVCLFGLFCSAWIRIDSWTDLAASVVLYTAVYCAAMWHLGLNAYEKKLISRITDKTSNMTE